MRLHVPGVALLAATLVVAGACSSAGTGPSLAPSADPVAEASQQVSRFFALLKSRDVAGIAEFLSPAFQLQRADGTGSDKFNYVAIEPADITSYEITELRATQDGDILVARYFADVVGTVNRRPYSPGPVPRLSVFVWNGVQWQLAAHANFNPPTN